MPARAWQVPRQWLFSLWEWTLRRSSLALVPRRNVPRWPKREAEVAHPWAQGRRHRVGAGGQPGARLGPPELGQGGAIRALTA